MNRIAPQIALLVALLSGCASTVYQDQCARLEWWSFATFTSAQRTIIKESPTLTHNADGTMTCVIALDVMGAQNDQVQAIETAVRAAVETAIKAAP